MVQVTQLGIKKRKGYNGLILAIAGIWIFHRLLTLYTGKTSLSLLGLV
jgi:hypothetical protein